MEWRFDPSVLIPKPVSPTTELQCSTHASGSLSSGCNGTSPTCTAPVYLSRKSLQQAQILVPLSQSLVAAHATLKGNVSPPRPFSTPGGEHPLRATALGGALEPQAEWPLHTINSTKAQEVRDTGFAQQVDRWFFLRIVLSPNSPFFPFPPSGSCPPSGRLGDPWNLLAGGLKNNLKKEKNLASYILNKKGQGGGRICLCF